MRLRDVLALALVTLTAAGCDTAGDDPSGVIGLAVAESDADVEASVARLDAALRDDAVLRVVGHVDFAAWGGAAAPSQLVLFSHPYLSGALLQADPRVGLDLPLGILAYASDDGAVRVAYDAPSYLAQRYRLDGVSGNTLDHLDRLLRRLAATAAGGAYAPDVRAGYAAEGQGIVTVPVEDTARQAYDRLVEVLEADDELTPVALADFRRLAQTEGFDVPYARLIVFEAPALTAPLFAAAPTIAADPPLKLLVANDAEGAPFVAYDDPFFLGARHGIEGADDALEAVRAALDRLATAAAQPPVED